MRLASLFDGIPANPQYSRRRELAARLTRESIANKCGKAPGRLEKVLSLLGLAPAVVYAQGPGCSWSCGAAGCGNTIYYEDCYGAGCSGFFTSGYGVGPKTSSDYGDGNDCGGGYCSNCIAEWCACPT